MTSPSAPTLKPQNGLAGLQHWTYDLRSGVMVAMVSLPFSMGIAITSGAPAICGVISAIIAGFVLPFFGGSYLTISGPAAGLAPLLFNGMITLATAEVGAAAADMSTKELLEVGYPLVLVAIALVGVIQIILARLKVARLSAIFPMAAIEGMLAAIGLLIIVKQFPLLLARDFEARSFWGVLAELPQHLPEADWQVLGLGLGCVAALFALSAMNVRAVKVLPPPVWVFVLGTLASVLFLGIAPEQRIDIPENPLKNGLVLPHFDRIFSAPHTWGALAYVVFLLVLVDGVESLATITAVDKLDPFKRRSDPDRTLSSIGTCNIASSMGGGLTIIPGIVKSTTNILGGGRTQWANFFNACSLLIFLLVARPLLNLVPLSVLASILVFVGFKLCGPKVWKRVCAVGPEQFVVFAVTLLVTVSVDLLIGIVAGVIVQLFVNAYLVGAVAHWNGAGKGGSFFGRLAGLFRSPIGQEDSQGEVHVIEFRGPLHCFNLFHVIRALSAVKSETTKTLRVRFGEGAGLVDHTSSETLFHYLDDFRGEGMQVEKEGWKEFSALSSHETAIRLRLQREASDPRVLGWSELLRRA